jgi:superfamily I DNA/RNA helicase
MFTTEQSDAVERVVAAVVAARNGTGPGQHFVVEAVAGAGKTHCLREMMRRLRERDPGARVLYLTFNCEAAARLRTQECIPTREPDDDTDPTVSDGDPSPTIRTPVSPERTVDACTMHAFGLRLLRRDVPDVRIDEHKLFRLWITHYGQPVNHPVTGRMRREAQEEWRRTRRYVEGRRNAGRAAMLAADAADGTENPTTATLPAYACAVWRAALAERSVIDQDEAIGHCLVYGARPRAAEDLADLVLVDECQDLNVSDGPNGSFRFAEGRKKRWGWGWGWGNGRSGPSKENANLDFLAHCVAVKERAVVCAVGDRSQAI